jgi:hypothetical protein
MLLLLIACTAQVDPCAKQVFFIDADGDGVGGERLSIQCRGSDDMVSVSGDCDDTDPEVAQAEVRFEDLDGDGWGAEAVEVCGPSSDTVEVNGDCDDSDPEVHPSAGERCDGLDTDCDGQVAEARVPQDYGTVQEALDAGEPWICLDEGVFVEDLVLPPTTVHVQGRGAGLSVIEGSGEGSVVSGQGSAARLEGVTLSGGRAVQGAGLHGVDLELELVDVEITENACESESQCHGTGFYLDASQAWLEGVEVHGNEAVGATGVKGVAGMTVDSWLQVQDSRFDDNLASSGDHTAGGALYLGGPVTLERVSVSGNRVAIGSTWGSAIHQRGGNFDAWNLAVLGNAVPSDSSMGCGVVCLDGSHASLSFSALVGNEVSEGDGCAGVRMIDRTQLDLLGTDISLNGGPGQGEGVVCGDSDSYLTGAYINLLPPGDEVFVDLDQKVDLGEGVINELPHYTSVEGDPLDWDLSLAEGSPLIDAGDPDILDLDGSRSDIGVLGGPDAE